MGPPKIVASGPMSGREAQPVEQGIREACFAPAERSTLASVELSDCTVSIAGPTLGCAVDF